MFVATFGNRNSHHATATWDLFYIFFILQQQQQQQLILLTKQNPCPSLLLLGWTVWAPFAFRSKLGQSGSFFLARENWDESQLMGEEEEVVIESELLVIWIHFSEGTFLQATTYSPASVVDYWCFDESHLQICLAKSASLAAQSWGNWFQSRGGHNEIATQRLTFRDRCHSRLVLLCMVKCNTRSPGWTCLLKTTKLWIYYNILINSIATPLAATCEEDDLAEMILIHMLPHIHIIVVHHPGGFVWCCVFLNFNRKIGVHL